jgi:hypothetical protein
MSKKTQGKSISIIIPGLFLAIQVLSFSWVAFFLVVQNFF